MSEIRRYRRFKGWDYSKGASLFVTIATAPRRAVFGRIVGGKMVFSPLGESVKVATPDKISAVLRRIESPVDKGYVVISGFISKGERAVRDMLCRRRDARFIRILPSCIPNKRFKPESSYVAPFAEGRYLEIAMGNDETEFGRTACLDLNAEIIEIATAGEGVALYWKKEGPTVLAKGGSHPGCDSSNIDGQTVFWQKELIL